MNQYHFFIEVRYENPVEQSIEGNVVRIFGYYQHFGVTFSSRDEALGALHQIVRAEGAKICGVESAEEVLFEELDETIKRNSTDPNKQGIWYIGRKIRF